MFRGRRKSAGWVTRQMSFTVSKTQSINGTATMFADGAVLGYDIQMGTLLTVPAFKQIQCVGFAYQSDLGLILATNATTQQCTGAECWYVDSFTGANVSRLNAQGPFLNLNEIQAGAGDVAQFPKRVLYRRRFSVQVANVNLPNGIGSGFNSVASTTSGWGTDRMVRKRFTLGRQEALFYRWELYGMTTSAASNITFVADLLGAITYRFLS